MWMWMWTWVEVVVALGTVISGWCKSGALPGLLVLVLVLVLVVMAARGSLGRQMRTRAP